jgi:hypothetical protein
VDDGVETDRVDVVGSEMEVPQECRPGIEPEPTRDRHCRVVSIPAGVKGTRLSTANDGEATAMALDTPPLTASILVYEIGQPIVEDIPTCPGLDAIFLADSRDGDHRADFVLGNVVLDAFGLDEGFDELGFRHL